MDLVLLLLTLSFPFILGFITLIVDRKNYQ